MTADYDKWLDHEIAQHDGWVCHDPEDPECECEDCSEDPEEAR